MRRLFMFLSIIPALVWGQDSLNVRKVGEITDYWGRAEDIVVRDTLAFVATGGTGLRVLNIAELENPTEIGHLDTPGNSLGVFVDSDIVYLADGNDGLRIVDVSNGYSPVEVGSLNTSGNAVSVTVDNELAYIAAGTAGLQVIDVMDLTDPHEIGNYDLPHEARQVALIDNLALVVETEGVWAIDVSTPNAPALRSFYPVTGDVRDITVAGTIAYIAADYEGLKVLEYADPENPIEVAHLDFNRDAASLYLSDSFLYVVGSGMQVIDVSSPSVPAQIGSYDVPSWTSSVAVSEHAAFVTDYNWGLRIIDVADPTSPTDVDLYVPFRNATRVSVWDNYAYVTEESRGLRILDVRNPMQPIAVGYSNAVPDAYDIAFANGLAYVASWSSGFHILDISSPALPTLVGTSTAPEFGSCIEVFGDYAYVGDGFYGISILDISDPAAPALVGFCSPPNNVMGLAISWPYLFAANHGNMSVIDVSDPTSPEQIAIYDSPGTAYDVALSGTTAFVADNEDVRIVDVSNPAAPVEIGYQDTPGSVRSVIVAGNHAFLATRSAGIIVIDISDPLATFQSGFYHTYYANDLAVSGSLVYVADMFYFSAFDVSAATPANYNPNELPTTFSLHPIYPNPFNNTANIAFDLPREVTGRLVVYDVLGRMTNTLYDGKLAAGSHQMQFNGNSLSSGTYFVRLESPAFTATRKATLLK